MEAATTIESRAPALGTFASATLDGDGDARELARRAALGVALAAIAGLAIGSRGGLLSMAEHAAGVPIALAAVIALGVPSLYVLLALVDAPLDPTDAARAAARALAASGLVLAGLAPALTLFVVTSSTAEGAALSAGAGLALGGIAGFGHLAKVLRDALETAPDRTRTFALVALAGFAIFAASLASRTWVALLPVLGGAS